VVPLYLIAAVTEHAGRVERSLRESEQRFRNIADTAPVFIWMSGADKLYQFFNKGWLEFTGRTLDEERGNGWLAGVHEADVQRCVAVYHSGFDARRPFEIDYRLRRHDGEYRWVLDRGLPRYDQSGVFLGHGDGSFHPRQAPGWLQVDGNVI
jgi:PAS domain S-box-containing protein